MERCPNCGTNWFIAYANGVWREGYCQHCSHETKVPSRKIENMPPPAQVSQRPRTGKQEKHWTKM